MKVLYIVRGLSGSGKSSIARELVNPIWDSESETFIKDFYSADDYFTDKKGNYNFNPNKLKEAHEQCQKNVELAMQRDCVRKVAVANTFSQAWEAEPYFKLAKKHDFNPFVLECQNDFGNTHGVPQESIDAMKERWEDRLR
jgi:predicted ATPase